MTTMAGDLDLTNRLRLTFEDDGDKELPLNHLAQTLSLTSSLCISAGWLVAYYSGAPLSPTCLRDAKVTRETSHLVDPYRIGLLFEDQRVVVWPSNTYDTQAPGWAIPRVARLSKQSSMVIDLVFEAVQLAAGGGVEAVVVAALKNPKSIGAWLPSVAAGWHAARLEALQARLAREQLAKEHPDLRSMLTMERDFHGGTSTLGVDLADEDKVMRAVDRDRQRQTHSVSMAAEELRERGLSEVQDEPLE